ncbi:MAG: hypothetical protein ABS34_13130 [Opitutaceae bacterium BACL24 MAG-120322-bin51]|nr:MAG: hypothetical protein ABS34_13130 [Opitutaceae bacterium BACL24 MAG-120322-bin51]
MKKIKKVLKLSSLIAIAITGATISTQAATVYSSVFDTAYLGNNNAVLLGGATPNVTAEEWFGATAAQGVTFDPSLTLDLAVANRYRGAGVWLDASAWAAGTVTVGVDVSNYTAGVGGSDILFQAYAANGVDASNSVSLDLAFGPPAAGMAQTGTATIGALGAAQNISGAATQDFTFTYNGTDQYIALVFALSNTTATTYEAATLDNLTVSTVPEPSTYALLAGLTGLVYVMVRRRRR